MGSKLLQVWGECVISKLLQTRGVCRGDELLQALCKVADRGYVLCANCCETRGYVPPLNCCKQKSHHMDSFLSVYFISHKDKGDPTKQETYQIIPCLLAQGVIAIQ